MDDRKIQIPLTPAARVCEPDRPSMSLAEFSKGLIANGDMTPDGKKLILRNLPYCRPSLEDMERVSRIAAAILKRMNDTGELPDEATLEAMRKDGKTED